MLGADGGVEHVADFESVHQFVTVFSNVHVERSVEHSEYLFAVVDMPDVGFVSPMQLHGCSSERYDQNAVPRLTTLEVGAPHNMHAVDVSREPTASTLVL